MQCGSDGTNLQPWIDASLATVAFSLQEMHVSLTQHTHLTVYSARWFVMICFGSLCFVYSYWEIVFIFTGNLPFKFTVWICSHFTILCADMWEATLQMSNMLFLNIFWELQMLKSHLSFSFLSFLIFFFYISTAKSIKMRCVTFCKIGIPCGGIQLKRRSYFVK